MNFSRAQRLIALHGEYGKLRIADDLGWYARNYDFVRIYARGPTKTAWAWLYLQYCNDVGAWG